VNVKVADVMAKRVVVARPHDSVDHVRGMLERSRIHAVPIVGPEGELLGVVSSADLARQLKPATPVKQLMSEKVYTVPKYDGVHVAARVMRNRKIHHLVVTHEQKVVGMLSSFDLLKLVEGHRFVAKRAPTPPRNSGGRR
jgi:CBS domain-containing protein